MSEDTPEGTRHLDVRVDCRPSEMGIQIYIHSESFNMMLELDPYADPLMMQSMLASAPQFIVHALQKIVADDSPYSAQEWWDDGMDRLGQVVATHVDVS